MANQKSEEFKIAMDKAGRILIPPHIRRDMKLYGKAAKIKVQFELLTVYENNSTEVEAK